MMLIYVCVFAVRTTTTTTTTPDPTCKGWDPST